MINLPQLGLPGGFEFLIFFFPAIVCFALWLWALIDILRSTFREKDNKVIWVLIVLFLPFFGAILYFFIGRKQKLAS